MNFQQFFIISINFQQFFIIFIIFSSFFRPVLYPFFGQVVEVHLYVDF